MADPVSWTIIGASALGALSSIGQANTQANNLQAQQNAANYNAELYQQQAEQSMAQAANNANLQTKNAAQVLGRQRAAIAESGIGFSGTGGDLIDQSAVNAELDRENTLYQGVLNAQSLNSQAQQSYYQADVAGSQIGNAQNSGYINAGANLLSGVGSYMGYKNRYNNAGYKGSSGSSSGGIF